MRKAKSTKELRKLTRHLIDGGSHGLFPGPRASFLPDLRSARSQGDRQDEAKPGSHLRGTGADHQEAIETTVAEEVGMDAVSVITPTS